MRGKIISFLIAIYCALLPLEEALVLSFGSIVRPFGYLIIGYSLIVYGIRFGRVMKVYGSLLLWLFYMSISLFWASSSEYWSSFIVIYVGQITLVLSLESVNVREIRIDYIRCGLILAGLIAAFVLSYFPTTSVITDQGRRSVVLFGNQIDPNIIATEIVISIHLCTDYILREKRRLLILMFGALILFLFYGLLLTGSRGAVISLAVGLIVMFALLTRQKKSVKKVVQILILVGIALLVIVPMLPDSLLEARFSQDTIFGRNELEEGSHNRYTIWSHALDLFLMNPLIGYGCGNFMYAIGTVYRVCSSHNLFILLFVEGGIIGASLFLSFLISIVVHLFRRTPLFAEFALLVSILIMSLTLDSICFKYFWIIILYSRMSIRLNDLGFSVQQSR